MQATLAQLDTGWTYYTPHDPGAVWWEAMTSPLALWSMLIAGLCVFGLAVSMLALHRTHRGRARRNPFTDNDGTATMELALVLPILLFFIMTLAQSSMMMVGNYMVHYSAYAAARVAIVQVPIDQPDDRANRYTQSTGRTKHDLILEAAAIALAPVGGESESSSGLGDQLSGGLADYFDDRSTPPWADGLLPRRMAYAMNNTQIELGYPVVYPDDVVELIPLEAGESRDYGTRAPITVFVEHKLNLGVPYANRIFATDRNDGSGYHRVVKTNCTLTNEGIRDELPPRPTVPRLSTPAERQAFEQSRQDN